MQKTRLQQLNAGRIDASLHVFALMLLLLLVVRSLDRRELDRAEAVHALCALAPLQSGPEPVLSHQPGHALLTGFAVLAGTTERTLRIPGCIALVLAALVTAGVAAQLFGPRGRTAALLAFCASGFVLKSARVDAESFAVLPAALLTALLLPEPRGAFWNCCALAGAALTLPLAAALYPVVTLTALFALSGVGFARSRILGLALLLALHIPMLAALDPHWPLLPPPLPDAPGFLWLVAGGGKWVHICASTTAFAALACGLLELPARPRALLPFSLALLAAACCAAQDDALSPDGARFTLLLPATGLLFALAADGAAERSARIILAVGLIVALLALLVPTATNGPEFFMRDALQTARSYGVAGSRLVLCGPDRFIWQYYAGRGHDPGFPILMCPEDVKPDALHAKLVDALGAEPGQSGAPAVLVLPAGQLSAPGLIERPLPGTRIATLHASGQ